MQQATAPNSYRPSCYHYFASISAVMQLNDSTNSKGCMLPRRTIEVSRSFQSAWVRYNIKYLCSILQLLHRDLSLFWILTLICKKMCPVSRNRYRSWCLFQSRYVVKHLRSRVFYGRFQVNCSLKNFASFFAQKTDMLYLTSLWTVSFKQLNTI